MPKLHQIKGLHHVTSLAADAQANNAFFTKALGLRRVKKTVNFDAPDVYHLYYGDEVGTRASVMLPCQEGESPSDVKS
jgi:glyoxalase family protein